MIRLEWADSRGVYWVGLTAICMMVWFSFAINKEATRYRVNTWTSILTVKLTSSLFVVQGALSLAGPLSFHWQRSENWHLSTKQMTCVSEESSTDNQTQLRSGS